MKIPMQEAIKVHEAAGLYFFNERTMRFFNSRIVSSHVLANWFVTGERLGYNDEERFTVRHIDWDTGSITTVGEYQQYDTADEAMAEVRKLASA